VGTVGAIAPVKLPGYKVARSYSAAEVGAYQRTGGDPAVLGYWTPKRMEAAKPLDAPTDAKAVNRALGVLTRKLPGLVTPPAPSTLSTRTGASPAAVTTLSITNGKLFIDGFESGSWCSASAINTPSKRVVVTAGHCVHAGRGGTWRSNLVFVPGYDASSSDHSPVGVFQAFSLRTFRAWGEESDLNRDVGFVTTYNGGDRNSTVVDTVGGHGSSFNGGTEFEVSVFGYPSNRDGGDTMSACSGRATDSSPSDNISKIACNFGPGSSGGPWLWEYDNSTGLGSVRSVMSTIDGRGVNRGPYFDAAVRDLRDLADRDWDTRQP